MENCFLNPPTTISVTPNEELDNPTRSLSTQLLRQLQQPSKFLGQPKSAALDFSLAMKMAVKFKLIKRLTPFLLFEFILPVIFIYLISTGKEVNVLLQLVFLLFLEINVMVFDFAFWNYFEGKRLTRIWLLEAPLVFLIIFFIV